MNQVLSLSSLLRAGTQQSHTAAENTAFMKCFIKGIVEQEPLRKLFADLYFVYDALEIALQQHANHPVLGSTDLPDLHHRLARAESLASDLRFYYGDDWQTQIRLSPAGRVYCDRIQALSRTEPTLLIAHAYTRYMGDLSGGQSLRKVIRSALPLAPDQGTQFYEFEHIATPEARRAFKEQYREALDALPVDQATMQRIVDEANEAFRLNRDIMHELEDDVKAAIGEHTFNLLTRLDRPGSTERRNSAAERELVV
jgi:heme oxygenase